MSDLPVVPHFEDITASGSSLTSDRNATVVGLYGISGSGKTSLLKRLKDELGSGRFMFYEGSELIASVTPGGLDAFQDLNDKMKEQYRQSAIAAAAKECVDSKRVALITGHFKLWSEAQERSVAVVTESDLQIYTHILYLDVSAETVARRRINDTQRSRPDLSTAQLAKWQSEEKEELRHLCRRHSILFLLLHEHTLAPDKIAKVIHDFVGHSEDINLSHARLRVERAFSTALRPLETILVLDADKTLAAEDSGALFWKRIADLRLLPEDDQPLKTLFGGPLGYSYIAFRQAALLNEEVADDDEFESLCQDVAMAITMRPEFVSLLHYVVEQTHVGAVVVTCGLRRVWDKILEREGLGNKVHVVGGGRIADGLVVSPKVKRDLVRYLQGGCGLQVWAFGDSPLDLDMMIQADKAVVIVGDERSRSKTMDAALKRSIESGELRARQVVLPHDVSPRLNVEQLPIVKLTDCEFVASLLAGRRTHGNVGFTFSTGETTKLLATPTRDSAIAGPSLREAHRRIGWYLAIEFLPRLIGLEPLLIRHVLNHSTVGYQIRYGRQTTVVALMRGGEPMAQGVNDALPQAMFVHASRPEDVKAHHLDGQLMVVLVDSVINTGKTIIMFVNHIRKIHATIRIVVVSGVIQAECISNEVIKTALAYHARLDFVALRVSETKFTGSGSTDTGNRLFNTTHLP